MLKNLYKTFNQELFDDSLPLLPVHRNFRFKTKLGRCSYIKKSGKWVPSKIDIRHDLKHEDLRKTLIHEMCHVWACIHFQEVTHGQQFWSKMRECGYPDGHQQDKGIQDKWQVVDKTEYQIGQEVRFMHNQQQYTGIIIRMNKRSITIKTIEGKWRVPPQLLIESSF